MYQFVFYVVGTLLLNHIEHEHETSNEVCFEQRDFYFLLLFCLLMGSVRDENRNLLHVLKRELIQKPL